jgi:hypothetical protein
MLKLYELRIGNLFEIEVQPEKKKIKKVREIKQRQILLDGNWYNLDRLIPIPITPEILLRCGFKKFDWLTDSDIFQCDFFKCILHENGLQIFADDFNNLKPLKYLHEFQNLYFALTGEQMEINIDNIDNINNINKVEKRASLAILSSNI